MSRIHSLIRRAAKSTMVRHVVTDYARAEAENFAWDKAGVKNPPQTGIPTAGDVIAMVRREVMRTRSEPGRHSPIRPVTHDVFEASAAYGFSPQGAMQLALKQPLTRIQDMQMANALIDLHRILNPADPLAAHLHSVMVDDDNDDDDDDDEKSTEEAREELDQADSGSSTSDATPSSS